LKLIKKKTTYNLPTPLKTRKIHIPSLNNASHASKTTNCNICQSYFEKKNYLQKKIFLKIFSKQTFVFLSINPKLNDLPNTDIVNANKYQK